MPMNHANRKRKSLINCLLDCLTEKVTQLYAPFPALVSKLAFDSNLGVETQHILSQFFPTWVYLLDTDV